jgi:hypothetical protein
LAGALLFDEKIRQRTALFRFGLPDVGILHSQAVIQRTNVVSPAFLEHSRWKRSQFLHMQTVIQTSRRIRGIFVFSASKLFSNIKKLKLKNLKSTV